MGEEMVGMAKKATRTKATKPVVYDGIEVRPAFYLDGHRVTVPLHAAAAHAMEAVCAAHREEFNEALKLFGLNVYDIVAVEWRRVVHPDEVGRG